MYMSDLPFPLHIRNVGSASIQLRGAYLRLAPSSGWHGDDDRLVNRQSLSAVLVPGQVHSLVVIVTPPLFAMHDSNMMDVGVEFAVVGPRGVGPVRSEVQSAFDWIEVREVPAHETAEIFVSFVDPDNENLATLASVMLRRAGLRPYLAREDSHPGCDYWADKIYPAIARSTGLFAIWTADTDRRPDKVMREITYAKSTNVAVGLFLSNGLAPPPAFPAKLKEHVPFDVNAPHEAFAHAIAAGRNRWATTGRFF